MRIFLIITLSVLIFGCSKNEAPVRDNMKFEIVGLPDSATVEQRDTLEIPVTIAYISGNKEQVTLQISGLPASLGAGFSADIDTPEFSSILRLVSNNADTGIYNIVVTASDRWSTATDSFKLHVVPNPVSPAAQLAGNYTESGPCTESGTLNHSVIIEEELSAPNTIKIIRLWNNNPNTILWADINPDSSTLVIAPQTVNGGTFSGEGSFTASSISINYVVDYIVGTDSCSVTLNK